MNWLGPYRLRDLLENSMNDKHPWPPDHNGVYVISQKEWKDFPTTDCLPLYAGGTTGKSKRFCTRVGDLIADMLGFFGEDTGHHSGGQHLYDYCEKNEINPLDLFLGWAEHCSCFRCAEASIIKNLAPQLNRKSPARCPKHKARND